jgi:hypothetical protein
VDPPVISVPTDTLSITVTAGETVLDTVRLSNVGGSDLIWHTDIVSPQGATWSVTPPVDEDERPASSRADGALTGVGERGSASSGSPGVLATLDILWHGDHEFGIGLWSVLISDLESRGAVVTESSAPITPSLLAAYDVLWFGNRIASLTQDEINAIAAWTSDGGAILIEADSPRSAEVYNELLPALSFGGFYFPFMGGYPGPTYLIYPHEITADVSAVILPGPATILTGVGPQGGLLVDDARGNHMAAYNHFGDGRMLVISDQAFYDPIIDFYDNRRLGNQVFDWFAKGANWLSVEPASGVLPAGGGVDLEITLDASFLLAGVYHQNIDIHSNDPVTPTATIPVVLTVITPPAVAKEGRSEQPEPTRFELHGNYPNPFNPTTTIRYDLPSAEHVRLEIFNIKGERIRVLVDRQQPSGRHDVVWDGRNASGQAVATGVYLYRLRAGSAVETRKMQLLK